MPNVLIKEYDFTNPGRNEYNNFSIVVPGLVGENYKEAVFDDNDIYEVDNQKDFIANVGCVEAGDNVSDAIIEEAVPAIVNEPLWREDASTHEVAEEYEIPKGKLVYRIKATGKESGKLVDEYGNQYEYLFTSDGYGKFKEKYYIIEEGNEGQDAKVQIKLHLGNQLAFELLGLGYTVLYKKIESVEKLSDLDKEAFWEPLKDRAVYDFRYITTGDYKTDAAVKNIINLAKKLNSGDNFGRGDCIALVDLPEETYKDKASLKDVLEAMQDKAKDYNEGDATFGKYTTYFAPHWSVKEKNINNKFGSNYKNNRFPAWLYYLACAKQAEINNYDEWFANAGYARGTNNLYNIDSIDYKFGDAAVEVLQNRDTHEYPSINPIITLKGNYYIWGNRTAYSEVDVKDLKASHFLNIRQLCCTLKKQIYIACRELTFEPNSNILWVRFCDKIRPILEKMKSNQGIDDYLFVKLETTKNATLKAIIRIVPIEAVEDFDISLTLEDSLEGTLVTFGEEDAE